MGTPRFLLTHSQLKPILQAKLRGRGRAFASLDLGLTTVEMALELEGVRLPDGQLVSWPIVELMRSHETACFALEHGQAIKVQRFSKHTDRHYSLMATASAPTLLVSGIPMHRIKDTDPLKDTLQKIRSIAPITGWVLDTATGLGYTAIEAAKTAEKVITVEIDPAVLAICQSNPWSRTLFDNPVIEQRIGDTFDEIGSLPDTCFNRIIHHPPAFSLAGDLYSGDFYRQMYRVLKKSGRLFHYVGDPESKYGRNITRGVSQRLREAGFERVRRRPGAFGLVATK